MNKFKLFFIFLSVLFSFKLYAENKSCIEMFGGYNNAALTDYNNEMQANELFYQENSYKAQFDKLNTGSFMEINYVMRLESKNAGEWGVYFKNDWLNLFSKQTIAFWQNNASLYSVDSNFSIFYSGFGLRKYFLGMYIGADAGAYYSFGNRIEEQFYDEYDSGGYDVTRDWSPFFFGANIECGVELWILKSFAISVKGGYRIAKGNTEVTYNEAGFEPVTEQENIDYSGPYLGAGIVFDFSFSAKKDKSNSDEISGW